jgi:hypothetical protein
LVYERYAAISTIIYKLAICSEIKSRMAAINEIINDVGHLKQVLKYETDDTIISLNSDKTYYCEFRFFLSISDFVEQDLVVRRFTGNV